ncbi:hypothetical protein VPH35_092232 [Triticum aestivum]
MTTSTGGVASAPSRAAAAPSKLPNAARTKKGKTSAKKNKAADGSGSSKARGKKLAACSTGAAATDAPASSLVEPAADAHHVFNEMPPSLNDDAYMSTMGVGSNNSHWSQTNDIHFEDHEFEVDEEVSRDPSIGGDQSRDAYWGRMKEHFDAHNMSGVDRSERSLRSRWSTINSDCQKWAAAQKAVDKIKPSGTNEDDRYNIAQNVFKEETRTTKKGKIKKGRVFTLPHCYEVLKDDEKWKKHEDLDDLHLSKKCKRTIELNNDDEEDDASSDDAKRSPTPNSARKEANEVRKMARNQDAVAEERRSAAEERKVAAEKRKVSLEERKVSNEERTRLLEWKKHLFFLDTSNLNEAQKEYVNLSRDEVLMQKRAMIRAMGGGGLGGMGGGGLGGRCAGGIGGMGGGGLGDGIGGMGGGGLGDGIGSGLGGMGGGGLCAMHGWHGWLWRYHERFRCYGRDGCISGRHGRHGWLWSTPPPPPRPDAMAAMGGMSFASLTGGMGAPPAAMGGMSFDVPPRTHSHEDAVEDLANTVGASHDAVRDEEREEDSSSEAEESSSEDDEDEDEEED